MDLQYMLIYAAIAVSLKLVHIVYLTSPFMLDGFMCLWGNEVEMSGLKKDHLLFLCVYVYNLCWELYL